MNWPITSLLKSVALFLFATASLSAWAQPPITKQMRTVVGVTTIAPLSTEDVEWVMPDNTCTNQRVRGTVELRVDHDYPVRTDAMDVVVELSIHKWYYSDYEYPYGTELDQVITPVLLRVCSRPDGDLVAFTAGNGCFDRDFYLLDNVHKFEVEVVSITRVDPMGTSTVVDELPPQVFIDLMMENKATCPIDLENAPEMEHEALTCTEGEATTARELKLEWDMVANAEGYQLEWTHVDDITFDVIDEEAVIGEVDCNAPGQQLPYDLDHNSTRITTVHPEYVIPLIFDKGWLVFRVRAIGRSPQNPEALIVGPWSLDNASGNVCTVGAEDRYRVLAHEAGMQWSYTADYAEEGKRKEVLQYADGTDRVRQSVTRRNSDGAVLLANTIYDRHGRPAISTLPAPVVIEQCTEGPWAPIRYYPGAATDASSAPFDWTTFDLDPVENPCEVEAPEMKGLIDYYYSAQYGEDTENADPALIAPAPAFVPVADGYAYQQTEYTPDGSGKVRRQGGVGETFQLENRPTSYLYSTPEQPLLDRLFGGEAGYSKFYQKVIAEDANGQLSATYLDISGRTVATSLIGEGPEGMAQVGYVAPVTLNETYFNAPGPVNRIDIGTRSITFTTSLSVPEDGIHVLTYDIGMLPQAVYGCPGPGEEDPPYTFCFECVYDLTIQLKDECGALVWEVDDLIGRFDEENGTVYLECEETFEDPSQFQFDDILEKGEYTLSKVITLHEGARQQYLQEVLSTCVTSLEDIVDETTLAMDIDGLCDVTCESCVESLGTREDFIAQGGNDALFDQAVAICMEACTERTWCEVAYDNMLSDMQPGGQYGKGTDTDGDAVMDASTDHLSVFHPTSLLRRAYIEGGALDPMRSPLEGITPATTIALWHKPFLWTEAGGFQEGYYNADGSRAKVQVQALPGGGYEPAVITGSEVEDDGGQLYIYPERLANLEDLVRVWRDAWARSLLYLHPEFCYYKHCIRYDKKALPEDELSSDDFDLLLLNAQTFEQAVEAGLIPDGGGAVDINWFDSMDPDLLQDPYYTRPDAYDGTTASGSFKDKVDMYVLTGPAPQGWRSMQQLAAYSVRCAGELSLLTEPEDCMAFGSDLIPGPGNELLNTDVRNREWDAFKRMYLAAKYRRQKREMDRIVKDGCDCPGFNLCIGASSHPWNLDNVHYQYYNPFQYCQPCSPYSWTRNLLSSRVKRFEEPGQQQNSFDPNALAYQQYLSTGVCPSALMFQAFVGAVIMHPDLYDGGLTISDMPSWSALMQTLGAQANGTLPLPEPLVTTPVSSIGDALEVHYPDGATGAMVPWECGFKLAAPDPSFDWTSITQVLGMTVSNTMAGGGWSSFALSVMVAGETEPVVLDGETCYDIVHCSFEDVCTPNALGTAVEQILMYTASVENSFDPPHSILVSEGDYDIYTSGDPATGPFFNTAFLDLYPDDPESLKWLFIPATASFQLTDGAGILKLRFIGVDPAPGGSFDVFSATAWDQVKAVSNFRATALNGFMIDVFQANGEMIATLTGEATFYIDEEQRPLYLGQCGPPLPAHCNTVDHQMTQDLYSVIVERMEEHWAGGWIELKEMNLFASPAMTGTLEGILGPMLDPDAIENEEAYQTGAVSTFSGGILDIEARGCIKLHFDPPLEGGSITSVDGPTFVEDPPGRWKITAIVHYELGGNPYTTTLTIESYCFDLTPCVQCPPDGELATALPEGLQANGPGVNDCGTLPPWMSTLNVGAECDDPDGVFDRYRQFVDPLYPDPLAPSPVQPYYDRYPYLDHVNEPEWMMVPLTPLGMTDEEFAVSGQCACILAYTQMLNQYYNHGSPGPGPDHPSAPPPSPEAFCASFNNSCATAFHRFYQAVDRYNEFVDALSYTGTETAIPPLVYELACSQFTELGYCNCVQEFEAAVNMVIADGVVSLEEELGADLRSFQDMCGIATPCPQQIPPAWIFEDIEEPDFEADCATALTTTAQLNATWTHQQLIVQQVNNLLAAYDAQCLGGLQEIFTHTQDQKEYHYTLYYYDRAGNLVRTVPPEGVEPVDLTGEYVQENIEAMRESGNQLHFTQHRLASDHMYNSLGQVTRTHVPDQDDMNVLETGKVHGLKKDMRAVAGHFVSNTLGFTAGRILNPSTGLDRGLLYRTNDGGVTWERMEGLVAEQLNKVQFQDEERAIAFGANGTLLMTKDGGTSWDLSGPARASSYPDILCGHENSTGTIAIGLADGKVGIGGPEEFEYLAVHPQATRITDIDIAPGDGGLAPDEWMVVGHREFPYPDAGILTHAEIPGDEAGDWSASLTPTVFDHTCVHRLDDGQAFIGGEQGVLLYNDPATANGYEYQMLNTGTLDRFRKLLFLDEDHGLAIMDSIAGMSTFQVLRATYDHGHTWLPVGRPEESWSDIRSYRTGANTLNVVGTRTNGLSLVGLSALEQSVVITDMPVPMSTIDASWCTLLMAPDDGDEIYDEERLVTVVVSGNDLYMTPNLLDANYTWQNTDMEVSDVLQVEAWGDLTTTLTISGLLRKADLGVQTFTYGPTNGLKVHEGDLTTSFLLSQEEDKHIYSCKDDAGDLTTEDIYSSLPEDPAVVLSSFTCSDAHFPNAMAVVPHLSDDDVDFIMAGDGGNFMRAYEVGGICSNAGFKQRPLPLNAVACDAGGVCVAVGDKGMVYRVDEAGEALGLASLQIGALADITCDAVDDAFYAVGEQGALFRIRLEPSLDIDRISTGVSQDLLSVVAVDGELYLGTAEGTILHGDATNGFTLLPWNMGAVRGLAVRNFSGGFDVAAVGDRGVVHRLAGNTRVEVKDIYPPALTDVHFANSSYGGVVGEHFTVRMTTDGGHTWRLIPDPIPAEADKPTEVHAFVEGIGLIGDGCAPIYSSYWTGATAVSTFTVPSGMLMRDIVGVDFEQALIVGSNGVKATAWNWSSVLAGGGSVNEVQQPLIGPSLDGKVFESVMQKAPSDGSTTPNKYVMGGTAGVTHYMDHPASHFQYIQFLGGQSGNPLANKNVIDLHSIDDRNAFAITDEGKVYRTIAEETSPGFSTIKWQQISEDVFDDEIDDQDDPADMYPEFIRFCTHNTGFMGGRYDGDHSGYARTLLDESGLYSQRFWYDRLGRLVLSQHTEQQDDQRYSYTLYDHLGRVEETGELSHETGLTTSFAEIFGAYVGGAFQPKAFNEAKFRDFLSERTRWDRVKNWYDEDPFTSSITQENLRNRIAVSTYQHKYNPDAPEDEFGHATHYSYDIHGNVKDLVQDMPEIANVTSDVDQRFKRIHYNYDLISGNVKEVHYQPDEPDQYAHRYAYDADNRLLAVETSRDGIVWNEDARYFYYPHGPLQRVELGDNMVQGIDYAYTLQGWLKAVNRDVISKEHERDMGQDGLDATATLDPHALVARDAYGLSLGYFEGDFTPINAERWNSSTSRPIVGTSGAFTAERHELFNGNISHMVSSLPGMTVASPTFQYKPGPLATVYYYDLLNRISGMSGYHERFSSGTPFTWAATNDVAQRYQHGYTYDANGNLATLDRRSYGGTHFDQFEYKYDVDGDSEKRTNRLYDLLDAQTNTLSASVHGTADIAHTTHTFQATPEDLNDPLSNGNNAYAYDRMGRLVFDRTAGSAEISWTPRGKVASVTRGAGALPELTFGYGVQGHRIHKAVIDPENEKDRHEFMVHDAQGQLMAVYEATVDFVEEEVSFELTERPRYGSSRLGVDHTRLDPRVSLSATRRSQALGRMHYELNDHLGNVHVTISDRKRPFFNEHVLDHFQADILSAQDYEPFGSLLPSRAFSRPEKEVPRPDLLWDFVSGNLNEVYGSGRNATAYGSPATVIDRCSVAASAYRFNVGGTNNQRMEVADHAQLDPGAADFSVTTWVKKISHKRWGNSVVGKWNNGAFAGTNEWVLNISGSEYGTTNGSFAIESGTTSFSAISNTAAALDVWHHLVGVRDGDTLRVFLNGVECGKTFIGNVAVNNVGRLMSMARLSGTFYGDMRIDEVAIYNRALSKNEVAVLYNLGCSQTNTEYAYRFGFQGQEEDDEFYGVEGASQAFEYRMHDARVGRFLSIDPLTSKYPFYSPYAFSGNRVIDMVELEGLEPEESGSYAGQGAEEYELDDDCSCISGTENQRWVWNNDDWNKANAGITSADLNAIFPRGNTDALRAVETSINLEGINYGLNSYRAVAHFLGQAGQETGGFARSSTTENLNYTTAERLAAVWPSRFSLTAKAGRALASDYINNAEKLGNFVYADRMGNGDVESGDGYLFRGRGVFQLTGRSNYTNFQTFYNARNTTQLTLTSDPSPVASDRTIAMASAMWFFNVNVLPHVTIGSATVAEITRRVNGGSEGLSGRTGYFNRALGILGK